MIRLAVVYGFVLALIGFAVIGNGNLWPIVFSGPGTLLIAFCLTHAVSREKAFFRTITIILGIVTCLADWLVINRYQATPRQARSEGLNMWIAAWFFWQLIFVVLVIRCVLPQRREPPRVTPSNQ